MQIRLRITPRRHPPGLVPPIRQSPLPCPSTDKNHTLTNPSADLIRPQRPRDRLFRLHEARAGLVLPALRHVATLPHRVSRRNGLLGADAAVGAARGGLRVHAGLGRMGPACAESVRVHRHDGVLYIHGMQQYRYGHHAAVAADSDRAAAELAVARQDRLGRHVLDGVCVRALPCMHRMCADLVGSDLIRCSVTVVSAVSLWKMMLAIDGHGDSTCESPPSAVATGVAR